MRGYFHFAVVLALAVALMAFFLRNADLDGVARAVSGARWDLLAAALAVTCASYLVRVVRWRGLLRPLGSVRFGVAFRATVMGFAASALLPGRVGELLRPYALARREGLSATAALATIVLERLLDLAAVMVLLGVALLLDEVSGRAAGAGLQAVRLGAGAAGLAAALGLGGAFLAAGRPDRAARAVERMGALLPARAAGKLVPLVRRFVEGLGALRDRRGVVVAAGWSLLHWVAVAAEVWLVTSAFDIALPVSGALVLMALTIVGVAVPTPAGIGGYHAAYQVGATLLYGAPEAAAVAAALVLHAVSFVPVSVVGLVFMAQEGVRLGAVRALDRSGGDEVASGGAVVAASDAGGRRR